MKKLIALVLILVVIATLCCSCTEASAATNTTTLVKIINEENYKTLDESVQKIVQIHSSLSHEELEKYTVSMSIDNTNNTYDIDIILTIEYLQNQIDIANTNKDYTTMAYWLNLLFEEQGVK